MIDWQLCLYAAFGIIVLGACISSAIQKRNNRKQRDFNRTLDTLLQAKESPKAICSQKNFRCILTTKRIIFENHGNFTAFPLKSIQKIKGINEKGNRTTNPAKMVQLSLLVDKEYILKNTGEEFEFFVKLLLQERSRGQRS